MTRTLRDRTADFLVVLSGPEERVEELQNHFADERSAGRSATALDVASLLPGVVRSVAWRALKDAFFWPVGIPLGIVMFLVVLVFWNLHFYAWDVVSVESFDYTAVALRSKTAVDIASFVGVLAAIPAGARMMHRLTMGWRSVLGVVATMAAAIAAMVVLAVYLPESSFPAFRPREVNEVPALSIGTYLFLTLLPVIYLVLDSLARMWALRSTNRVANRQL